MMMMLLVWRVSERLVSKVWQGAAAAAGIFSENLDTLLRMLGGRAGAPFSHGHATVCHEE